MVFPNDLLAEALMNSPQAKTWLLDAETSVCGHCGFAGPTISRIDDSSVCHECKNVTFYNGGN